MISRKIFKEILLKHFKETLVSETIDTIQDLGRFEDIRNEDFLISDNEILLNIYACFLLKELDFTLTAATINSNQDRIKHALRELKITDPENPFSSLILKFKKNISAIKFTQKRIKFHYWTKEYRDLPAQINTIAYKLINPVKGLPIEQLGKYKIFINGEIMLECLREIERNKQDIFDNNYTKIITRPSKTHDEFENPFSQIIKKRRNPLTEN
jgi:hypothetical protein